MKLILGQGNPGDQFTGTRHNAGFWALDHLAARETTAFVSKTKFQASVAEFTVDGEKILLAKPLTFYNETGLSYLALCDFYKITPENSLIIHDDLALPFGTLRVRQGGSGAGNNGIKSLNAHGGHKSWRLRVGIANEQKRWGDEASFVLAKFSQEEQAARENLLPELLAIVDEFCAGEIKARSFSLPTTTGTDDPTAV